MTLDEAIEQLRCRDSGTLTDHTMKDIGYGQLADWLCDLRMNRESEDMSEFDAVLWDIFRRGGEWVAASEYRKLKEENDKLRELAEGLRVCNATDADARECPLYDEDEPDRCKRGRLIAELGLEGDEDE